MNINSRIKLMEERIMRLQKEMEDREKRISEYSEKPKPTFKLFRRKK